MRKIKRFALLISTLIMSLAIFFDVCAMSFNPNDHTSVDLQSELLPSTVKSATAYESAKRRGDFFMRADLIIKDDGNGDIGAFAKAYMAVPVEEVYITIYLDRWDEEADRWRQVSYYDYEFYANDYPDGLIDPSIDITFKKQTKGYYYRIRGVFAAVNDGDFEGFSPVTDGILIN